MSERSSPPYSISLPSTSSRIEYDFIINRKERKEQRILFFIYAFYAVNSVMAL